MNDTGNQIQQQQQQQSTHGMGKRKKRTKMEDRPKETVEVDEVAQAALARLLEMQEGLHGVPEEDDEEGGRDGTLQLPQEQSEPQPEGSSCGDCQHTAPGSSQSSTLMGECSPQGSMPQHEQASQLGYSQAGPASEGQLQLPPTTTATQTTAQQLKDEHREGHQGSSGKAEKEEEEEEEEEGVEEENPTLRTVVDAEEARSGYQLSHDRPYRVSLPRNSQIL
jgi:hypothetical protein